MIRSDLGCSGRPSHMSHRRSFQRQRLLLCMHVCVHVCGARYKSYLLCDLPGEINLALSASHLIIEYVIFM